VYIQSPIDLPFITSQMQRIENFVYTMVKFGLSSCSMMVGLHEEIGGMI
jgi:hypothetical protein